MKLDLKDKRILEILTENCRYSIANIARAIKLSKDATRYRINNLISKGIIYRFLTLVNYSALGYNAYIMFIQLQNINKNREEEIYNKLISHKFVFFVAKCSGRWDINVNFLAKDILQFDQILKEINNICSQNMKESDIIVWIKDYRYSHLLKEYKLETKIDIKKDSSFSSNLGTNIEFKMLHEIKVDRTDLQILDILSEDARAELTDIGKKIGMSGENVKYRIRNLIKKGVIVGFNAIVDVFKINNYNSILLLKLQDFNEKHEVEFEAYIRKFENAMLAVKTTGRWDILIAISDKDLQEFHEFLTDIKDKFSNIIRNYEVIPLLNWYKYNLFPKGLLGN